MKPDTPLLAYCGVDCSACPDYLNQICPSCKQTDWKEDDICLPVECCRKKKIEFCAFCDHFPCKNMAEFYEESDSHREAYERMSAMRSRSSVTIRLFEESDAKPTSEMIIRTLRTSNSKDYSSEILEDLIRHSQQPENVRERASRSHFYVAEADGRIVGCGGIGPYWDSTEESYIHTFFVAPEWQGKGLGRRIMEALEADELFLQAKRVEIHASITAVEFYRKLGYDYKDRVNELDEKLLYHLEKYPRGDV